MSAHDQSSVEDRLAALHKVCDDRAAALEKKVADQEQNWTLLKWAAGILGTAILIVTGVGFIQIPKEAVKKAIEEVTPIANEAAKKEVEKLVSKTVVDELGVYMARVSKTVGDTEELKKKADGDVKDIQAKRGEAASLMTNLAPEFTNIKTQHASMLERARALDVPLAGTYDVVDGKTGIDPNGYVRVGKSLIVEGDKVTMNDTMSEKVEGKNVSIAHNSTYSVGKDGTVRVEKFLLTGKSNTDSNIMPFNEGTRLGKHIFWANGEHWVRTSEGDKPK